MDSSQLTLVSPGTLTVATIDDVAPMLFRKAQRWTGYEADIIAEIARRLSLSLRFERYPFDGIWLRPGAGECDVAAAALTILPERASQGALFTRPILRLDQSLLVRRADLPLLGGIQDLAGQCIGVVPGTTGESSARARAPAGAVFQSFVTEASALAALRQGTIDAFARGTPGNSYQAGIDDKLAMIGVQPTDEWVGLAVAPANPALREALDAHLSDLRRTGDLARLHRAWFPDMAMPDELLPAASDPP